MTISKQQLRDAALMALTNLKYAPVMVSGPGIVPGARLKATKGPAAGKQIAVRTSQDRELGLLRRPDNKRWRTIPKMHEVIVAVPSLTEPDSMIDVFCFAAQTVVEKFDAALKGAGARDLSLKAPVFVALDDVLQPRSGALAGGLAQHAKWHDEIPVEAIAANLSIHSDDFIARVDRLKRDFAEHNGVDVSKVAVEFRIVT